MQGGIASHGNGSQRNINIAGTGLPDLIRQRRRELGLTGSELADRAGVSERTIRAIERGQRTTVQEKTLLLLAEALSLSPAEVLDPAPGEASSPAAPTAEPSPPAAPRRWSLPLPGVLAGVGLVVVAVVAWLFLVLDVRNAHWEVSDGDVVVLGGVTSRVLARVTFRASVTGIRRSPWSPRDLLIQVGGDGDDGGRLLCLDLPRRRVVWEVEPDRVHLLASFAEHMVTSGKMGCREVCPLDTDGDGHSELAVHFRHTLFHPTSILQVDAAGRRLRQYDHRGHIRGMLVVDLDGDGRDELLLAGTCNGPRPSGATVVLLDAEHWGGVSGSVGEGTASPDSSRVRLVFPHWGPAYEPWIGKRVAARRPRFSPWRGRPGVLVEIGTPPFLVTVFLDHELRTVRGVVNDDMAAAARSWPDSLRGPGTILDPDWRERWWWHPYRFEGGRLVAAPSPGGDGPAGGRSAVSAGAPAARRRAP